MELSFKGKLLLSEPFLTDSHFKRSVILLTEDNKEGTVGFILNRKSELFLNDVLPDFPPFHLPLYIGGPVQTDTLHFLHKLGERLEGSVKIVDDVYWSGNFEKLRFMVDTKQVKPEEIRFYTGYSGWVPGQLNFELKEQSWIVTEATRDYIFSDNPEQLWKKILKNMGKNFSLLANFPTDPSLN